MGHRLLLPAAAFAAALACVAAASARTVPPDWAGPQIRAVARAGLMGTSNPATFRPNDVLTAQALENLAFGLTLRVFPPVAPTPVPPPVVPPATTTTTTTDTTATTTVPTTPTTVPTTTTAPATTTAPTTTTPAPAPVPPPKPRTVTNGGRAVTMTELDTRLVSALDLSTAAAEFAQGARAAGLEVPARFGTEVVARLLGLRLNHPASQDSIELLPGDPATRAEAAYSAAQVLAFGGWEVAGVQSLADAFALPHLSDWQRRILDTAVARIGMPYIWGGTNDGPETEFGIQSRGGYDCSGFVWRVYKLQPYTGERSLASVLRGRTTYVMSAEVPVSQRIHFADLQPADVIFFGGKGPRSQPADVGHMGIYLGNGWFIHSSGQGVALATLDGWYRREFAWGRRPLREAGLSG